ncbi:MAG: PBP1A family penicillin-binding protein [Desulfatibacillum sp.]|nr:PBP1A family penicillin-binding protein [Desulfatibacillum sp.]
MPKTNDTKARKSAGRSQTPKRGLLFRLIRFLFFCSLLGGVLALCAGAALYFHFSQNLPQITSLADYQPPIVSTVYSDDGRKIGEFFKERRIVIPLDQMPPMLLKAFVSAEDSRFYKHAGTDILGIIRAMFKNIEAGAIVQGGSTITQQVTRSFLLTREKSYERKIKEAILARRIDKAFSKEEVLYLYLNQIYLGHGAYGVEAASQNYFGIPASQISLAQCAVLAGLPQAPSRYSPFHHWEKAKARAIYVLNRMHDEQYITNVEVANAVSELDKLDIKPRRNLYIEQIPHYTEYIRRYVENKYGEDLLYTGGLTITTAANIEMQKMARSAIERGLRDLDKREGYRGPITRIQPEQIEEFSGGLPQDPLQPGTIATGVVVSVADDDKVAMVRMGTSMGSLSIGDMKWARQPNPDIAPFNWGGTIQKISQALAVGDVIEVLVKEKTQDSDLFALALEQEPLVESALLCIETETGHVKAMVGGRDFATSKFNRAYQSRRQPGSAFKPIIYSAAIDKGYTPATILHDTAVVFGNSDNDFTWKPQNYKEKFHGKTLLRDALAKSRNVPTVKIMQDISVSYVINYARKFGIKSDLSPDLSLALGSSGLSVLELVQAYSVFANQGFYIEPCFVTRITDRKGNVLEEYTHNSRKAIDQSTAYVMTHLLQGVVEHGTGWRAKALERPAAGKTGTTNDLFDAWFVGYTPRLVTGVWAGYDNEKPMGKGETGSRAACPIWLDFMQQALKDKPVRVFPVPEGVDWAKIDAETGLLAIPESKKTVFECFKQGTVPTKYSPRPGEVDETSDLFRNDLSQ